MARVCPTAALDHEPLAFAASTIFSLVRSVAFSALWANAFGRNANPATAIRTRDLVRTGSKNYLVGFPRASVERRRTSSQRIASADLLQRIHFDERHPGFVG